MPGIDISVIVPVFNVGEYILDVLNDIEKNVCRHEVIIINDGSTDDTLRVVNERCKGEDKYTIISQKNKGVSVARNAGLLVARGKYICFVDGDDKLPSGALDSLLAGAKASGAEMVYGGIRRFNKSDFWVSPIHLEKKTFSSGYKTPMDNPELYYSMGPCAKLLSSSLVRRISPFREKISYGEDQAFIFEALLKASSIFCIGEYVYFVRERDLAVSEPSAMQQRDKKAFSYLNNILSVLKVVDKVACEVIPDEERRIDNVAKYYDRSWRFDIWPLLLRVIKYDKKNANAAFGMLIEHMKETDARVISACPGYRYFLVRMLSRNLRFLRGCNSLFSYIDAVSCLMRSLGPEVYDYFRKKNTYGASWNRAIFIRKYGRMSIFPVAFHLLENSLGRKIGSIKERLIRKVLFPLFSMMPIKRRKVIFVSPRSKNGLSGNFDHIINSLKRRSDFGDFVIFKYFGNQKRFIPLVARYFNAATADVIFLEDYTRPYYGLKFRKGTRVVQLWHACGAFKRFGFDAIGFEDSNSFDFESSAHGFYTDVITSSSRVRQIYANAFNVPFSSVKALGVPRSDLFFKSGFVRKSRSDFFSRNPLLKNKKLVLYAPTFRGRPERRYFFAHGIDWNVMREMGDDFVFMIKLHPSMKYIDPDIPDFLRDRVLILRGMDGLNQLMAVCDVFVTDYSSSIFEYSLLGKPIVYYMFDIDKYHKERSFYFDVKDYIYGDVAINTQELIAGIGAAYRNMDKYEVARKQFVERFMGNSLGGAADRVVDYFWSREVPSVALSH